MSQTQYVSPEGFDKLKQELIDRKTTVRKLIAEKIGDAKELGDLSENFEYHDAKDEQSANESRILELENLMHNLIIVNSHKGGAQISVGSTFSVKLSNDQEKTFQIVGASEADPLSGKISNESPIGNKFLGLAEGDEIVMDTQKGPITYKIVKIM